MREKFNFVPPTPRSTCSFDFGGIFGDDDDDSGGGQGSSVLTHLIDQAATLTNTALLSDANPVNTAILTNTPISTPNFATGVSNSSLWIAAGLGFLGILAVFAISERR